MQAKKVTALKKKIASRNRQPKQKAVKKAIKIANASNKNRALVANTLEPARPLRNPNMDTYRSETKPVSTLPAELQFQMAKMAPDLYSAPFVENGNALDIPTMKIVGNKSRTFVKTNGSDANVFGVVFNAGFVPQWYAGFSPLNTYQSNSDTTIYQIEDAASGDSFSSVFGNLPTFYDKLYTYSTVVDVELIGPEATVTGLVHVGTIALGSFQGGVSIAQLIQQADKHFDLKDPAARIIRLRSAISNRAAIHQKYRAPATGVDIDQVKEEYISYAVYHNAITSLLPVVLPETSVQSFTVNLGVTSQCMWWPEGSQPMTKGLAVSTQKAVPTAKTTPIDTENASLLERIGHFWSEPNRLGKIVEALTSRKSIRGVIDWVDRLVPGVGTIASAILEKSMMNPAPLEDDISLLRSVMNSLNSRMHFSDWSADELVMYDDITDKIDALIVSLSEDLDFRKKQREIRERGQFVPRTKHGQTKWIFLDCDGHEYNFLEEHKKWRDRRSFRTEKDLDRPKSLASISRR
jgi:hypothetical protein